MKITPYLKILAEKEGSDIYMSTGAVPSAKFSGVLTPMGKDRAPPGWVESLANEIMSDKQKAEFKEKPEMNLALSIPDVGDSASIYLNSAMKSQWLSVTYKPRFQISMTWVYRTCSKKSLWSSGAWSYLSAERVLVNQHH